MCWSSSVPHLDQTDRLKESCNHHRGKEREECWLQHRYQLYKLGLPVLRYTQCIRTGTSPLPPTRHYIPLSGFYLATKIWSGSTINEYNTVEPPNKGHFGNGPLVLCSEVVPISEVHDFSTHFDCIILNKLVNALKCMIRAVEMIIKWLVCSVFSINIAQAVSEVLATPKSLSGFKANIIIAHAA